MNRILKRGVEEEIISQQQAEQLSQLYKKESIFTISNLLIYFGGLSAIGSVTFFITMGFLKYGYISVIFSTILFFITFLMVLDRVENVVAKGVVATMIVFLTPLFVYGVLGYFGMWDIKHYPNYYKIIDKNYLLLEISTILASIFMLKKIKYPFLILPIAFSLWFMSMDITELIFDKLSFENRRVISLIFGFYTTILAYYIDNKKSEYSFWLYLFGVIMFWSGLTFTHSSSEFAKFVYFLINIVLLLIGVVIKRKVFLTFGSLGVIVYFFHLSELFRNSFIFVYMVTFMGIAFVWIGSRFDKYEEKIKSKLNFNININKKVLYIVLMILPLIYLVYFI